MFLNVFTLEVHVNLVFAGSPFPNQDDGFFTAYGVPLCWLQYFSQKSNAELSVCMLLSSA